MEAAFCPAQEGRCGFLAGAFCFQFAGWLLVGNLFLTVYLFCHHIAAAYLLTLFGIAMLTAGEAGEPAGVLYYMSIHRSMYRFYEAGSAVNTAWRVPGYYMLSFGVFFAGIPEVQVSGLPWKGK